jgi:SOS-response transcriptional repressor LexA
LSNDKIKERWTEAQGQYLAFIFTYDLLHDRSPSEAEMQRFFRVSPPSAHRMVVELEKKNLIRRTPGVARSIKLLVPADEVPVLKRVAKSR